MRKNEKLKIVTVVNNFETFDRVIKNNENINNFQIFSYDNTNENIGISERYNNFIEENVKPDSNFWIVFCHQDFGFNKNPYNKILKLNKKNVYGAIGVQHFLPLLQRLKFLSFKRFNFYPSIKFNILGLNPFCSAKFINFEKTSLEKFLFKKKNFLGQIKQGNNDFNFSLNGTKIYFPKNVENLDCCCMIVHSSLLNKHHLKFDEELKWHMYVEDFCFNANLNHGINVKAVQLDCFHLSKGNLSKAFYKAAKYVKEKYNLEKLSTTCIN